ncbi:MAG: type II/IV secretion system protein [Hydrogenophaga sp.]|uniref:GspE/PulE family protein n=1 Tax=Hydrogenophaga sp. TaxID=1904254 RepID=UPI001E138C14|nr:GspE/PulE family protein [Hydrogenophaga sp.]MBX3609944.1 type II/IV secretion system protein [Hydrogenophaga sp.]
MRTESIQSITVGPLARDMIELAEAADQARHRAVVALGDALVLDGCLDAQQVDALRRENPDLLRSRSHELVERFLITDEEWQRALARVAGLPDIDADAFETEAGVSDLLPASQARGFEVLPLGHLQGQFVAASWRPTDETLHQQLQQATGHAVWMVWADREAIQRRQLGQRAPMTVGGATAAPTLRRPAPASATTVHPGAVDQLALDQLVALAVDEVGAGPETQSDAAGSDTVGMVQLVNRMIADAQRTGASDIHIETNVGERLTLVRMRHDGDLEPYLSLPASLRAPLVSRIKIMARLDIAERRRPQDGKIDFSTHGGAPLELRVAVLPTHDGLEDVVLRLLASSHPLPLSRLGLQARDRAAIEALSRRSFGMVLAAGPTGSGKTTTLHSMLAEVNTPERKIWTAEDPIEITQAGLRQVQMNDKIGLTFASAMRSFLRADPDIIMIGEIRDTETAKIAIEASLTGHLVLSTLHTNSASESVVRLLDLGMDPMNFADSLLGIVAQRLVRCLCPACARRRAITSSDWDALVDEYREGSSLTRDEAGQRLLEAAGVDSPTDIRIGHAVGCSQCKDKGHRGRIGVYEILQNGREIRTLIQDRARPSVIFDTAVALGMRSLRHDALEKVVQGLIDLPQARTAYH